MTTDTKDPAEVMTLELIKNRQHYIVKDPAAYALLKRVGLPLLRIHQDFLPLVEETVAAHGISVSVEGFAATVFEPWLERMTRIWSKRYGTCKSQGDTRSGTITLLASCGRDADPTTDEKLIHTKQAIDKLSGQITQFFKRWGYRSEVSYSETMGGRKIKLHIEYRFDAERVPVIDLETPIAELKEYVLKLGFDRLVLQFDAPKKSLDVSYVHVRYEVSQGGTWTPIRTSKCLPTQISNVLPLFMALSKIRDLDRFNSDNECV